MSSGYLVRMKGTKELVGFFVVRDLVDLYWSTDEVTDPALCEYARVASGGIIWPKLGTPKDLGEDDGFELDGAVFSDKFPFPDGLRYKDVPPLKGV